MDYLKKKQERELLRLEQERKKDIDE